jgi:hypothetical protein
MFDVTDIAKGVAEGNFLLLAKTISQILASCQMQL